MQDDANSFGRQQRPWMRVLEQRFGPAGVDAEHLGLVFAEVCTSGHQNLDFACLTCLGAPVRSHRLESFRCTSSSRVCRRKIEFFQLSFVCTHVLNESSRIL